MSRVQIANLTNTTQTVIAEVNYITKANGKQIVKLSHVTINNIAINHCWLYYQNFNKPFIFYKSSIGRKITFTATISTYYKFREGKKVMDYCLTDITNIKFI